MVKKYEKGARAERELARILKKRFFAVVRSAGSGSSLSTPDLIAIKRGRILAFECKAWKRVPKLKPKEYSDLVEWCERAGAVGFLAWKNTKWLFLNIKNLKEGNIKKDGITVDELFRVFDV